MSRDPLDDLLHDADRSAPPPPSPRDLAEKVRGRARARTVRRRAAVAVVLPLAIAGTAALLFRKSVPTDTSHPVATTNPSTRDAVAVKPETASSADRAALLAEARRLESEASVRLAVAGKLAARRDRRRREAELATAPGGMAAPGVASLEVEREKAALTLLDHGDRLRRDLKEVDAALAAYRRTVELFPDTRWAAVAQRRLEEIRPDSRRAAADPSLS